mmetsp:Transcript_106812/g.341191  ORF Transcript_106812/g.341191 Transcript_106812/m.341191 type:complete len:237 (+) Transcript_106812:1968-2678(+)
MLISPRHFWRAWGPARGRPVVAEVAPELRGGESATERWASQPPTPARPPGTSKNTTERIDVWRRRLAAKPDRPAKFAASAAARPPAGVVAPTAAPAIAASAALGAVAADEAASGATAATSGADEKLPDQQRTECSDAAEAVPAHGDDVATAVAAAAADEQDSAGAEEDEKGLRSRTTSKSAGGCSRPLAEVDVGEAAPAAAASSAPRPWARGSGRGLSGGAEAPKQRMPWAVCGRR